MYLAIGDVMPIGIIACAFGQQQTNTAGPSNEAIGQVALRIKEEIDAVISTQWEVEAYLRTIGASADNLVSTYGAQDHYITTEQVFTRSLAFFEKAGVSEAVIVAQPMHLMAIRLVAKGWIADSGVQFISGYSHLMRQIPFDRSEGNVQKWTRGPIRFGAYLVRAKLFGTHGS